MKDLTIKNADGDVQATFRAEMLSNAPANIEILEIRNSTGKVVDSLLLSGTLWQRLNYSWKALLDFCNTNSLKLSTADTNGKNAATIIA